MNIYESGLALIRIDSRFQRNLNRTCVQRIVNAHETQNSNTNTRAYLESVCLFAKPTPITCFPFVCLYFHCCLWIVDDNRGLSC